ncbi:MAG TPA: chemotaxis protein CheC [Nitrospirae bacterium]|nr:chemotaxis protein CheC [Nitrospirota bacterium]
MNIQTESMLTDEEIEIFQEIMNIAFGKSAADLADVIDTHVVLSVPYIRIMHVTALPDYFREHVKDYKNISIVEQKFWGRFKGDALLVFSAGAGKELVSMLQHEEKSGFESDPVDILERETLMEVGNILIGACVGKIAELLKDVITYTPPMIIMEKYSCDAIYDSQYNPDGTAIVLKTDFSFDNGNVSGFLFLVTSQESIRWLKDALRIFIEQYE